MVQRIIDETAVRCGMMKTDEGVFMGSGEFRVDLGEAAGHFMLKDNEPCQE